MRAQPEWFIKTEATSVLPVNHELRHRIADLSVLVIGTVTSILRELLNEDMVD